MPLQLKGRLFNQSGVEIPLNISTVGENISSVGENMSNIATYRPQWLPIKTQDPGLAILQCLEALFCKIPFMFLAPGETPEAFDNLVLERLQNADNSVSFFSRSSGTSGRPKLVARHIASWIESFQAHAMAFELDRTNRWLVPGAPVFSATVYHALLGLYLGKDVYLQSDLSPRISVRLIHVHQVDTLLTVPTRLSLILKAAPKNNPLTHIITVGERLLPHVAVMAKNHCLNGQCWHYYGASELGQVAYATYDEIIKEPTLLGIPFVGVEPSHDNQGNITVKSPYTALDYPSPSTVYDKGFWNGHQLYFKGRDDLQINRYGKKVSLEPLQAYLTTHMAVIDYKFEPNSTQDHYQLHLLLASKEQLVLDQIHLFMKSILLPQTSYLYFKPEYTDGGKLSWGKMKPSEVLDSHLRCR